QNQIITELIQQEYEVYIAKDHTRLGHSLKKYPDSILFINIDEAVPKEEWERWVRAVHSSMPEVKVGVFSANNDEKLQEKYLKNLRIKCGFMILKLDMSRILDKLLELLNALNVKGRRKYLRASTERESKATMNMPLHGEFVNASIRDISVVGFSCSFESDPGLVKNEILKDIQIRLQSMLIKVEAVVFGSRTSVSQEKTYVFIFTQRIDPDVRVKIRKYIQQNLQSKMDIEIN
ncbi:MAG: pilus assembly protein PilZ, partial [Treponema sp.]|nr:pilus assembly protein PilZ [Treponema sp.]